MKDTILKFFKPSRKKIITMVVLVALAAGTVYLLIGAMFGCALSWGCDTLSFGAFIANVLGLVLVAPAYYIYAAPQMIFGDLNLPMGAMIAIMIVIELVYLYLLSCSVVTIIGKFKSKRKGGIFKNIKKNQPWFKRRIDLILVISFAVIILFDGLAFPRRLDYVLQLIGGASFIIEQFSTAFKIMALSIFEIWYLVFLFLRRNSVVWNKVFIAVMWIIVFVLLALNSMMLVFGFLN